MVKEIDLGKDLESIVIELRNDYETVFQETSSELRNDYETVFHETSRDIWHVLIDKAEARHTTRSNRSSQAKDSAHTESCTAASQTCRDWVWLSKRGGSYTQTRRRERRR